MIEDQEVYDNENHILVVDDDNTLLKFFKIHLNKYFSKVIVVKNAKEAIESMREKEIDLIISDINMPRVNGFDLMKKVRKIDISIPFLLVSGALLDPEEEKIAFAADGYLRKPFDIDQLHEFISGGITQREHMKKLLSLVKDEKKLRKIMNGKIKLEKAIKSEQDRELARNILQEIKTVA